LKVLSLANEHTFEQCLQQFSQLIDRQQLFRACSFMCYLLEGNLLTKQQRLVAFYVMSKVYSGESLNVTPFDSIVLSTLNQCMQIIETQPDSH